jgi:hypothetical protein
MMKVNPILEGSRYLTGPFGTEPGSPNGMFGIHNGPSGRPLLIVASDGIEPGEPDELQGWEHVSVSIHTQQARNKGMLPNWIEMSYVKQLFWDDEDCVVQFHPPKSDHVNNMPVLHLWCWTRGVFPRPPSLLVGVKEVGEFRSHSDVLRAQGIADEQVAALLAHVGEGRDTSVV